MKNNTILLFFYIIFFLLSSCSKQEKAEIQYKGHTKDYFKSATKSSGVGVVSRKLEARVRTVQDHSTSSLIKKKEINEFAEDGVMKNYQEVRTFEKKKIDHDNYPEGDNLREQNNLGKNEDKSSDSNIDNKSVKVEKEDKKHIKDERFIIIRPGDSIGSIADEYNVKVSAIEKANDLQKPYTLEVGKILKIPEYKIIEEEKISTSLITKDSKEKGGPVLLSKKNSEFIMPVEGEIICSFQEDTEFGHKNEGINFAANLGDSVHSVASGVVIYASNQLEDYGNLVLVKHDNSLITTYAHLHQILVKKGQNITVGDIIGKVGSTGNVASPQLHFAVRKGKEVVDPMLYLPQK